MYQALCKAEDEQDALAATMVKAEQAAELAEFSEGPADEASEVRPVPGSESIYCCFMESMSEIY